MPRAFIGRRRGGVYKMRYMQCNLVKGNTHQTAWLPEKYAINGKILTIEENGKETDGWMVETVYDCVKLEEKYLDERSRDYKKTRKASDI